MFANKVFRVVVPRLRRQFLVVGKTYNLTCPFATPGRRRKHWVVPPEQSGWDRPFDRKLALLYASSNHLRHMRLKNETYVVIVGAI